jgi:hypothetical protein
VLYIEEDEIKGSEMFIQYGDCATGWTTGVRFPARVGEFFLFATASRSALGPTQPLIQRVPGALSRGLKRPESKTDHPPQSSADVKNTWGYTSTPPIRLHDVHTDNFTFANTPHKEGENFHFIQLWEKTGSWIISL